MFFLGVKLKAGVTPHHLQTFLDKKWVPELSQSRRIGMLTSLTLYAVNHAPQDEFVLVIDGFVVAPSTDELNPLCEIVYSLDGEEMAKWPKVPAAA